jgi:sugar fermentation stimulation protein A
MVSMQYQHIKTGTFLRRPNRFIAQVEMGGVEETVHVKNTGRCKELLVPGCTVYLEESTNPKRKTRFDLVAVEKKRDNLSPLLINMDAQAPNQVFGEFARSGKFLPELTLVTAEKTFGHSRFDFYLERSEEKIFVEVKGCTLEEGGVCRFPDAPTERGTKHVHELISCLEQGYRAFLCLVVQMEGMTEFRPNDETDPAFGKALREASQAGVIVKAYQCHVEPDGMEIVGEIPVIL